jgi:hypothetical protein
VALLAIVMAVGVVSAVVLLEQIQPAVPVSGVLTGHCNPTAATPPSVTLGGSGEVTFSCSSGAPDANPAFTATATVIATPVITGFAAPYNTTRLYIFDADGFPNTGGCSGRAGPAQKIEDGVRETIPAGGWNYCAEYVNVGLNGLATFTVTWNL